MKNPVTYEEQSPWIWEVYVDMLCKPPDEKQERHRIVFLAGAQASN